MPVIKDFPHDCHHPLTSFAEKGKTFNTEDTEGHRVKLGITWAFLATRRFRVSVPDQRASPANPSGHLESRSGAALRVETCPDRDTFAFAARPRRKARWRRWHS